LSRLEKALASGAGGPACPKCGRAYPKPAGMTVEDFCGLPIAGRIALAGSPPSPPAPEARDRPCPGCGWRRPAPAVSEAEALTLPAPALVAALHGGRVALTKAVFYAMPLEARISYLRFQPGWEGVRHGPA
jgi:hypothetical protein